MNALSHTPRESHTILLIQFGSSNTRVYSDYESVSDCCKDIISIYEQFLGSLNTSVEEINIQAGPLMKFIDDLPDIGCLVFQKADKMYVPYDKFWILEKVLMHFKRVAAAENETE